VVEKKGPVACDAGPLKANSINQPALFRASAFKSQQKNADHPLIIEIATAAERNRGGK
jgi:hypothetical protein